MKPMVLIVDDEPRHRDLYARTLERLGLEILEADSAESAEELISARPPDMVISDVRMPGADGLALLSSVRARHATMPFLLVTAYADVREAVVALKLGAVDYLKKPVDLDELGAAVADALHLREPALPEIPAAALEGIVAESPAMRAILADAWRVAASDVTVLITGESGSGKEVISRFIHEQSRRAAGSLVSVNCAAIPATLLASELFGHERGAFTGAIGSRAGRFREADGGTLFLDEIGDLPLELQPALLRALESGRVCPVGADHEVQTDFRLIAATNHQLEHEVHERRFREDLYYRINVFTIELPPLRERPADILPLARHFLRRCNKRLSPTTARVMQAHPWPGNVRELANAMERASILARSEVILPEHLPPALQKAPPRRIVPAADVVPLDTVERQTIERTLVTTGGNRTRAAELLGISRRALVYKLKRYQAEDRTVG